MDPAVAATFEPDLSKYLMSFGLVPVKIPGNSSANTTVQPVSPLPKPTVPLSEAKIAAMIQKGVEIGLSQQPLSTPSQSVTTNELAAVLSAVMQSNSNSTRPLVAVAAPPQPGSYEEVAMGHLKNSLTSYTSQMATLQSQNVAMQSAMFSSHAAPAVPVNEEQRFMEFMYRMQYAMPGMSALPAPAPAVPAVPLPLLLGNSELGVSKKKRKKSSSSSSSSSSGGDEGEKKKKKKRKKSSSSSSSGEKGEGEKKTRKSKKKKKKKKKKRKKSSFQDVPRGSGSVLGKRRFSSSVSSSSSSSPS